MIIVSGHTTRSRPNRKIVMTSGDKYSPTVEVLLNEDGEELLNEDGEKLINE